MVEDLMEDEKLNKKIYLTLKRVLVNYVTTTDEGLDDEEEVLCEASQNLIKLKG